MCHVVSATWRWAGMVCAVVDAAGARLAVGDVAIHGGGGGPSVLVWGGDGDGGR
jgi:hypothetical protein